jgi:hypothetical protein
MKNAIVIVGVLVIVGALIYAFTMMNSEREVTTQVPPTENVGNGDEANNGSDNGAVPAGEIEVRGTVVSVNTDQVPVDGPALVNLRLEDGTQAVVAIRSMGINLCPAQANIADVYKIKAGDRVEARGQIGVEGMILPCESPAHYLRVVVQ